MSRSFTHDDGTKVYWFGRDGMYIDAPEYYGKRFRIKRSGVAVAWMVVGRVVESAEVYDEETGECIGTDLSPTDSLACIMVGDDREHVYDESDLAEITEAYDCGEAVGCTAY